MNGLDFAIVIALSVGAIYGLSHGAIRMLTSVVALVGGVYFASVYYPAAANLVQKNFGTSPVAASLIGYLIIFGALFFVIEAVGNILMRMLLVVHLSWFDRLVGSAVGATVMAVIAGIIVMLMAVVLPADAEIIRNSQLAPRLLLYNHELVNYIPDDVKQAYENKRAEIIRSWIEKETRLTEPSVASPSPSPSK
ncbi:MAG TPA: CvpA family protein [Candidatus Binataceae bacterium]|nr:CvpA family protein [Candidatus Binataceae bacterium]